MNVSELLKFDEKCTGCYACYNICPVRAISMEYKEDGFLYPKVAVDLCINGGLCIRVCSINIEKQRIHPIEVYSLFVQNDILRNQGSSGELFLSSLKRLYLGEELYMVRYTIKTARLYLMYLYMHMI